MPQKVGKVFHLIREAIWDFCEKFFHFLFLLRYQFSKNLIIITYKVIGKMWHQNCSFENRIVISRIPTVPIKRDSILLKLCEKGGNPIKKI